MGNANKAYKDRLFHFLFGREEHKDWTLSLYNAVNGTAYTDPEQISITTIEQVLYMGMHKDDQHQQGPQRGRCEQLQATE